MFMKKNTKSIATFQRMETKASTKSILLRAEQIKLKGGANPWLETD